MPSSKPKDRLSDIAENVRSIIDYTAGMDEAAFLNDRKTQATVERCLLRIAEAAVKLGAVAEERLPGHNWAGVRGIGNILRHEYDGVDPSVIWVVVADDLPPLLRDVETAFARHGQDQERAGKIAHMQALLTEGLESGISDETLDSIRASVRAGLQSGKSGA